MQTMITTTYNNSTRSIIKIPCLSNYGEKTKIKRKRKKRIVNSWIGSAQQVPAKSVCMSYINNLIFLKFLHFLPGIVLDFAVYIACKKTKETLLTYFQAHMQALTHTRAHTHTQVIVLSTWSNHLQKSKQNNL